jgi:hypothetical protein
MAVSPTGESGGHCDCCGQQSRKIWGHVANTGGHMTVYYVHWTVGSINEHPPNFDLILGEWGEHSTAADRALVSLDYNILETGPAFRVIDAAPRLERYASLATGALRREDVMESAIAAQVFAVVDAILAEDDRARELLDGWTIESVT